MSENSMNNEIIQIERISSEQHIPIDNPYRRNSTGNDIHSKQVTNLQNQMNDSSIPPDSSSHPTAINIAGFILFTILIIIVGILIVCLTQLKQPSKTCVFLMATSARNSISNDSRPRAVVIADFNNDGLEDIVVPNSGMNNIGIFLRHTNGTFTAQMIYSTGSGSTPYAVAVNDFNNDQRLDIVVANFGSHTIGIFLGIGDGTFKPQATFSTGSSRPQSIAVADFNEDLRPDIAVVNYATNNIGIFLQDINGSFANQTTFSTGYDSDPYSIAIGDLDNDQKLDIVVANYGTHNVGIFLGHGNGTFAMQMIFSTGINSHPSSIAIDDLNDDSYLDIVVACSGANNIAVLLGYGQGNLNMSDMYSTGNNSSPHSVVIADLDNDNNLDIVVANYGSGSVIVLLGDGNGYFSNPDRMFFASSNFNPYSIATADFNGDNRFDIAVVNYDFNYIDIILNYKSYSFHSQIIYNTYDGSRPTSIVTGDLNNDNYRDMIVANYWDSNVGIFIGYGDGTFSSQTTYYTGDYSEPCSIAVGDFNNDNETDFVVTNYGANNIGVFLGYGNGTFSSQTNFSTGEDSHPFTVAVGDFNSDDRLDIVVANFDANNIGIFLGYGDGRFYDQIIYSTGSLSTPNSVAIGDFDNNHRLDIVVANFGTDNVGVFLGHGNGTFSNQNTFSTGFNSTPSSVAVGDFNNDNRTDIIVTNYGTDTLILFLGDGNGVFTNSVTFSTGVNSAPWSIAISDFNNDNQLDVSVANRWSDNVGVFLGYGDGTFSSQLMQSTGSDSIPWSVAAGDLNDDGYSDIAVANYGTSDVGIFIGDGNGNFTTQQTISTAFPSRPRSVAVGDFDDDGLLDITVANYWTNTLDVFLAYEDGTFSSRTTHYTGFGSQPYAVAFGHFNNDSYLDIVVTNYDTYTIGIFLGYGNGSFSSQTTYSTGNNSQPCAIAVGDFNNDERLDIAVANEQNNNMGIFFGYGDGTFRSQVIFSTGSWSQPTSIAAGDFNNDTRLDIVVINFGTDNMGVFLGHGDGTFSNQTAYSTRKGTSPIDAAIGDLNNDGRLDIVVTLYHDFGIITFLGKGDGTFARQLIYSTGSQSHPYACVLGDINNDNRLDVFVSDTHNGNIVVALGDGHGSFSSRTSYSTGANSYTVRVALGDFNNDRILDFVGANFDTNTIGVFIGFTYINGIRETTFSTGSSSHPRALTVGNFTRKTQLDIVISNYGLDNVEILSQDSNRTFPIEVMLSTGDLSLPTSIDVGDFNNDSKLDITVANSGTENIGVFYGYGNGSFMSQTMFPTGLNSIPQSVTVGDINNDKRLDIVVADSGAHSVFTLLRNDIGALGNQTVYSTGTDSNPMWVVVGDLNSDNWLDFVVANGGSDNVGVFLGSRDGTFSSQTTYSTGSDSFPRCVALADVNNDSHLDIIVGNYWDQTLGIFLGFGNGTFFDQTIYATDDDFGPFSIAIGDFTNDNQPDIVVANYRNDSIVIFLGYDNGTFSNVLTYSTGSNSWPSSVTVGDLNNDNQLDIVVANVHIDNIGVFIGYGDGNFSLMISYSTGSGSAPLSVVVGHFNNDDRMDVAVSLSGIDTIGVLFGNGNGTFSNQMNFSTGIGSNPYGVAVADLNKDNQLDIVIANLGSNSLGVLLGFVNGTFFNQLNYFIGDGTHPYSIAIDDFNNDNRLDVIVVNSHTDSVSVFFGYVEESFLTAPSYPTGTLSQPTSIALGDFDNDTRLDVVVANNGIDRLTILYGSGYGTFIGQTTYLTGKGSHPCWVTVGDLNNDSRLDIVVANSGANNVGVFLSNGTGTFSSQRTYSTGLASQPQSVGILDFDNDTRLDIAVANSGSNSVVVFFGDGNGNFPNQLIFNTGFDSRPYAITVGDINNDDVSDIIATNNGYGNVDIFWREC